MGQHLFVLGATGAVGPHAVRALLEAGHTVTALARSEAKAGAVARLGATPAFGSIFDVAWLTGAFTGHDAVVNLAKSIPNSARYARPSAWRENARIRNEGTRAVVDAALAAGVPRLVQESIALAYRDSGADWVDEETPLDVFSIAESTPVSERDVQRFINAGGTAVVLRFGLFYGPGSTQSTEMLLAARLRFGMVLGHSDQYWSPIFLPDAGQAVAAAGAAPAGVYNAVDDEPLSKRDFADAISIAVGRRSWVRGPGRLAGLPGEQTSALTRSLRVSNTKLKQATGWSPDHPSAREGWRETAKVVEPTFAGPLGRILAGLLALLVLPIGIWATFFPADWYRDFPGFSRHWAVLEPPYNAHLITDLGGFYLAFGVLAMAAAAVGSRGLIGAAGLVAAVEAVPHFAFHLHHVDRLGGLDGSLSLLTLASQFLVGVALIGIARATL